MPKKKITEPRYRSVKIDAATYDLIKTTWAFGSDEYVRVSISGVIRQAVREMAKRRAGKRKGGLGG